MDWIKGSVKTLLKQNKNERGSEETFQSKASGNFYSNSKLNAVKSNINEEILSVERKINDANKKRWLWK